MSFILAYHHYDYNMMMWDDNDDQQTWLVHAMQRDGPLQQLHPIDLTSH